MIMNFDTKMKGWMEGRSIILSILREISFTFKITLPKMETRGVFKSNVLIWTSSSFFHTLTLHLYSSILSV